MYFWVLSACSSVCLSVSFFLSGGGAVGSTGPWIRGKLIGNYLQLKNTDCYYVTCINYYAVTTTTNLGHRFLGDNQVNDYLQRHKKRVTAFVKFEFSETKSLF